MIRVEVEGYCSNCCDFKPSVDKTGYFSGDETLYDTVITCKHAEKCELIRKYLEKHVEK